MRDKAVLIAIIVVVALAISIISLPEAAGALLIVVVGSGFLLAIFGRYTDHTDFIVKVFFWGLFVRLVFGIFVHIYDLRSFFGGDAITYDFNGNVLINYWYSGVKPLAYEFERATKVSGSGWGMNYLIGGLYSILGRNILAAQSFCAVVGAVIPLKIGITLRKEEGESLAGEMAG